MYSGTTFNKTSGRFLGAHQKIDRIAVKQLQDILPSNLMFPNIKEILHFEGHNGPDAVKRKSPAKDEPWHYFMPYDNSDKGIIDIIESHYNRLVQSLKQNDEVRSAFEAAWLAHAIVDGLTPAHHFPYGQKIIELRGGQSLDSRSTIKDKLIFPGTTAWRFLLNNWRFWGPKGLMMTHIAFEMGIATMIKPLSYSKDKCLGSDLFIVNSKNLGSWYRKTAQMVVDLDLYNRFYDKGWTTAIASDIKDQLLPLIIRTVVLVWYGAAMEADKTNS